MDPGQDEMGGGLADDMDVVALYGDAGVAGPAVGFHCGVEGGGGFDEVAEVSGVVGGDFGQPQAAGCGSIPELDGADDQHFAVVAAPPRGAIALGAKGEAGLVDFDQTRQWVAPGSTIA